MVPAPIIRTAPGRAAPLNLDIAVQRGVDVPGIDILGKRMPDRQATVGSSGHHAA
jgi:hypothetical protein